MSTSTNASKGSPDDDEGRLGDGSEPTADEVVEDADVDDVAGSSDTDEPGGDSESEDAEGSESADDVAPAAAARGRDAAKKRAAGTSTKERPVKPRAPRPATRTKKGERGGPIAAIVTFVRQVIAELRKVVTPTSKELGTYVAVVIVFVLVVMAYVGVLDLAVGKLVLWAFGG